MNEAQDAFFGLRIPFLRLLGVQAEQAGGGTSRISLELRPELMNSFEVSHGGVIMTLLDVAMAVASRGMRGHPGGVMTVDMSVSFLRSARGRIVAEGKVLRGGRSLFFCEGEAFDESGELVAKSLGTFKLRKEM
ncbi:MAG: PaaI family thioesterase, partial [Rhodocyclaceae bacterium]|nr:PaaI family thioesterase [Rhodocyclaceae bacterium]